MYKTLTCKITDISPLLMRSGQLADPLHPITQQIRTFSGKRDKTEADLAEGPCEPDVL